MYCLFILSNLYTINKRVLYYLCCVKYYIHVTIDYINTVFRNLVYQTYIAIR